MKKNDVINVYWAPATYSNGDQSEWEMLYPDPKTLYQDIFEKRNKNIKNLDASFFACPAVQSDFKNTFVFKNVVRSEYEYNYNKENNTTNVNMLSINGLGIEHLRDTVVLDGPSISFSLSYVFFADQSLDAYFSSPYFHKPGYIKYGSVFPGNFNIGKWFRPYNFEVQMWNNSGNFIVEEDEPLFYINFKTSKKIKLHRFKSTYLINKYIKHCTTSSNNIKTRASLAYRYKIFTESRFNQIILSEIKNNLVGENDD